MSPGAPSSADGVGGGAGAGGAGAGAGAVPAGAPAARGLLLVLAGPSGVGKTTIVHEIIRRFGGMFSVSATTRQRGGNEMEGVDYYFVDEPTFQQWINQDRFLEYAQVFGRTWYGTPEEPVRRALAEGRLVILDIDVQGAEQVRRKVPDMLGIFVLPPSEDELLKRLRARGRDDEAAIQRRFAESKREIARAKQGGTFDHFVTNDTLPRAIEDVAALVAQRRGARA
ncbi:MAG: guanylate kinase [Phycisphaerales bacterium]